MTERSFYDDWNFTAGLWVLDFQSTLLSPTYLGFTVIHEHVPHADQHSCDKTNIFCTCHTYSSCADWLYIPYAALEYVQDLSACDEPYLIAAYGPASSTAQALFPAPTQTSITPWLLTGRPSDICKLQIGGQCFSCTKLCLPCPFFYSISVLP